MTVRANSDGVCKGFTSQAEVTAQGQLYKGGYAACDGSGGLVGTDVRLYVVWMLLFF